MALVIAAGISAGVLLTASFKHQAGGFVQRDGIVLTAVAALALAAFIMVLVRRTKVSAPALVEAPHKGGVFVCDGSVATSHPVRSYFAGEAALAYRSWAVPVVGRYGAPVVWEQSECAAGAAFSTGPVTVKVDSAVLPMLPSILVVDRVVGDFRIRELVTPQAVDVRMCCSITLDDDLTPTIAAAPHDEHGSPAWSRESVAFLVEERLPFLQQLLTVRAAGVVAWASCAAFINSCIPPAGRPGGALAAFSLPQMAAAALVGLATAAVVVLQRRRLSRITRAHQSDLLLRLTTRHWSDLCALAAVLGVRPPVIDSADPATVLAASGALRPELTARSGAVPMLRLHFTYKNAARKAGSSLRKLERAYALFR